MGWQAGPSQRFLEWGNATVKPMDYMDHLATVAHKKMDSEDPDCDGNDLDVPEDEVAFWQVTGQDSFKESGSGHD